jgi:hypothetical protein
VTFLPIDVEERICHETLVRKRKKISSSSFFHDVDDDDSGKSECVSRPATTEGLLKDRMKNQNEK